MSAARSWMNGSTEANVNDVWPWPSANFNSVASVGSAGVVDVVVVVVVVVASVVVVAAVVVVDSGRSALSAVASAGAWTTRFTGHGYATTATGIAFHRTTADLPEFY